MSPLFTTFNSVLIEIIKDNPVNAVVIIGTPFPKSLPSKLPEKNPNKGNNKISNNII